MGPFAWMIGSFPKAGFTENHAGFNPLGPNFFDFFRKSPVNILHQRNSYFNIHSQVLVSGRVVSKKHAGP